MRKRSASCGTISSSILVVCGLLYHVLCTTGGTRPTLAFVYIKRTPVRYEQHQCKRMIQQQAKLGIRRLVGGRTFVSFVARQASTTTTLSIESVQDMEELGGLLAALCMQSTNKTKDQGETILLKGDLGAGKTSLVRGFIRTAGGDSRMTVTSPTYLLSNTYNCSWVTEDNDAKSVEIYHMDLYRLENTTERSIRALNLPHVFQHAWSLIEWPCRLSTSINIYPSSRLDISIRIIGAEEGISENAIRNVEMKPQGPVWTERIETLVQDGYLEDWLTK